MPDTPDAAASEETTDTSLDSGTPDTEGVAATLPSSNGEDTTTLTSPFRADNIQSLDGEGSDQFGHREYADAIVRSLPTFPSPFTLGLFGPWGTGKSTILGDIGKRLNGSGEPESAMAVFDAWRYEGDSLRREFIREVGAQLDEAGALDDSFELGEEIKQFDVSITKPEEAGFGINRAAIFPALVAAALAFLALFGVYFGLPLLGATKETVLQVEMAMIGSVAAFVLVVANRVVVPVQLQESRQRFEFPDQFASSFRRLLGAVRAKRLVIGIDNLDRCSPRRVTQILSTVKGFLEPALVRREDGLQTLCFVIAADDEALRRHLAVEEAARVAEPGRESESREAVEEAVDEYLRKFFNASVRIADALEEDMLGFTKRELHDFLEIEGLLDDAVGDQLVEMTAQALKRNPRRVKQFVNGLTLRLQVFEDRRKAGRVQIEPDILVIAKLAILEEEFRAQFKDLREDHSLLEKWQEQAGQAEGNQGDLARRMVGFLRFTDDIQIEHIGAYLTQKQTIHERELPGYGEFTEELEEGRSPAVISDLPESELEAHRAAAKDYFDRAVRQRAWSTAHNTARAILATPGLQGSDGKIAAHVLDEALSQQELKERLPGLEPRELLPILAKALSPYRCRLALEVLLTAAADPDSETYRSALADGLAGVIDSLDQPTQRKVADAFAADGVRQNFASYQGLAAVWPEMIGDLAVGEAFDQLQGQSFVGDEPAFALITEVIGRDPENPDWLARLLEISSQSLASLRVDNPIGFAEVCARLTPLIAAAHNPAANAPELASELAEAFDQTPEEQRPAALELGLALCALHPDADGGSGDAFGRRAREVHGGPELGEWIFKNHARLAAGVREGLKAHLREEILADGNSEAIDAVGRFPAEESEGVFAAAATQAAHNGSFGIVETLIGRVQPVQREEVAGVAAERLAEVATSADQNRPLLEFVLEHQRLISQDALGRIASGLVTMIVDRRETADELGVIVGRVELDDPEQRLELTNRLLDLEREVTDPNRKEAVLHAAAGLAGSHSSNAQKAVSKRLDERESSNEMPISEAAERVRGKR